MGRHWHIGQRWVHPGVMLSCPRNFLPNTSKSLSDQQPNSSSASCAEAQHASSRLFPNSTLHSHIYALGAWFVYKCLSNMGHITWHRLQYCAWTDTQVSVSDKTTLCRSHVHCWTCVCLFGDIASWRGGQVLKWVVYFEHCLAKFNLNLYAQVTHV